MSDFDSIDQTPPPVVSGLSSIKRHVATITIATPSRYRPQVRFRLTERFWSSGSLTWLFSRRARIPVRFSDERPGPSSPVNRAVMDPGGKARLEALLAREPTESHPLYVFTLPAGGGMPPLEVTARPREGVAVVEFEPVCLTEPAPPGYYGLFTKTVVRLENAATLKQLCDIAAENVRPPRGFDCLRGRPRPQGAAAGHLQGRVPVR